MCQDIFYVMDKIRWGIRLDGKYLDEKYDGVMKRSDLRWDWGQEKFRNIVEMLKLTLRYIYAYL